MANLHEVYESELLPKLKGLDFKKERFLAICLPVAVFSAITFLILLLTNRFQIVMIPAVIFVISVLIFYFKMKKLTFDYKELVIRRLLQISGTGFTYYPEDGISQKEFEDSRIFSTKPNIYSTEDLVTGRIGQTDIRFAEIRSKRQTNTGKSSTTVVIFSGIFFIADFHKHFYGSTWVLPDNAERLFGSFVGSLLQKADIFRPGRLVRMEDVEFERLFAVYSTDEIECRYILTPSMMERMVRLRNQYDENIYFAFINSSVIIALTTDEDIFEAPSWFRRFADFNYIECHYNRLESLFSLVEDLNLNTRIWTKE